MMYSLIIPPEVLVQIEQIQIWYEAQSDHLLVEFLDELEHNLRLLRDNSQ